MPYARPGGPQADVACAHGILNTTAIERGGAAEQLRTWNLSSSWRIPTTEGPTWLKVVAPFFAQEGLVLATLDASMVAPLRAASGERMLLGDVPGEDQ
jgi:hypothetical protein